MHPHPGPHRDGERDDARRAMRLAGRHFQQAAGKLRADCRELERRLRLQQEVVNEASHMHGAGWMTM